MKKILLLLSLVWSLFSPPQVQAATEFTTSFFSRYRIEESGNATVSHEIKITNNLAHIYPTVYTVHVTSDQLHNITASDQAGILPVKTQYSNGTTTIDLTISRPNIGLGKTQTLTLQYTAPDLVTFLGPNLALNIPRMSRANEHQNYTREVTVPPRFANLPHHFTPDPDQTTTSDQGEIYIFQGHPNESLSLLFGDTASYRLNLSYSISNPTLSQTQTEIALPPDTPYQQIILHQIDPPPSSLRLDADGNWLATYSLGANATQEISVELFAVVSPVPLFFDPSLNSPKLIDSTNFWPTENSLIQTTAAQLQTAAHIYTYLIDYMSYDYSRVGKNNRRLGAVEALTSPTTALCTEFTDSFIALARSLEIPAREINGFAYTTNPTLKPQGTSLDILHSWPEYYDAPSSRWLSLDPTWGQTTGGIDYLHQLDFSHIAFVRHGLEDDYPLPAGAYKASPSTQSIQATPTDELPARNESFTYSVTNSGLTVYNNGNVALTPRDLTLEDNSYQLPYLPPYASHTFPLHSGLSTQVKLGIASALALLFSIGILVVKALK